MSRYLLLFTIGASIIGFTNAKAQNSLLKNYKHICRKSKHAPFWVSKKLTPLSEFLTRDFEEPEEKLLALSTYILYHVKYDFKGLYSARLDRLPPQKVLKRGKALCSEYSNLLVAMCDAIGIEAAVINGYTLSFDNYPGDTLYYSNHAWNVVNLNGNWNLCDLTWAKGYTLQKRQWARKWMFRLFRVPFHMKFKFKNNLRLQWIFGSPELMLHSHLPELPFFQVFEQPMPVEGFVQDSLGVEDFLNANPNVSVLPEMMDYIHFGPYQKGLNESQTIGNYNPKDHHGVGLGYFKAFEACSQYLNTELDSEMLVSLRLELDTLSRLSDSLIRMSKIDVKRNYLQFHERNKGWKERLTKNNREFGKRLSQLNQVKSGNISRSRRCLRQAKGRKSRNSVAISKMERLGIYHLTRPVKPDSIRGDSTTLVKMLDSLGEVTNSAGTRLKQILMDTFSQGHQVWKNMLARDLVNMKETFEAMEFYSIWNIRPLWLIHLDDFRLNKSEFNKSLRQFEMSQSLIFDARLSALESLQKQINDATDAYIICANVLLTKLRNAKKLSKVDLSEDARFEAYKKSSISLIKNSTDFSRDICKGQNFNISRMKREKKMILKIKKELSRDSKREYFRYNQYLYYIKTHENIDLVKTQRMLKLIKMKRSEYLKG